MRKNIITTSIKFLFGVVLCCCFYLVNAETQIRLNTDKTELDISELVEIRVDISTDEELPSLEIQIPGIDNFHVIGNSQSQSTKIVGNNQTNNFIVVLTLKAKTAGTYILGPLEAFNETSNTVEIEVTGVEIFTGGQIDSQTNQSTKQAEALEKEEALTSQQEKEKIESIIAQITGEEKQFQDIMENSNTSPLHPKNSIIFLILLGLIYFLAAMYKKYIHIFETKKQEQVFDIPVAQTDFQGILKEIETDNLGDSKDIFYGKLGDIIRKYLDEKIEQGLSSMTFGEVQKKIQPFPSLSSLYEKVYFPEYNTKEDTKEQRIELLHNLQDELI